MILCIHATIDFGKYNVVLKHEGSEDVYEGSLLLKPDGLCGSILIRGLRFFGCQVVNKSSNSGYRQFTLFLKYRSNLDLQRDYID